MENSDSLKASFWSGFEKQAKEKKKDDRDPMARGLSAGALAGGGMGAHEAYKLDRKHKSDTAAQRSQHISALKQHNQDLRSGHPTTAAIARGKPTPTRGAPIKAPNLGGAFRKNLLTGLIAGGAVGAVGAGAKKAKESLSGSKDKK